jgi:hypothetical protein
MCLGLIFFGKLGHKSLVQDLLFSKSKLETAEDEGFEPSIGFPIHAFQACALGRYANPPGNNLSLDCCGRTLSVVLTMIHRRSSVRHYRAELPQGRNAARVGPL